MQATSLLPFAMKPERTPLVLMLLVVWLGWARFPAPLPEVLCGQMGRAKCRDSENLKGLAALSHGVKIAPASLPKLFPRAAGLPLRTDRNYLGSRGVREKRYMNNRFRGATIIIINLKRLYAQRPFSSGKRPFG